jgi:hypothetical protein
MDIRKVYVYSECTTQAGRVLLDMYHSKYINPETGEPDSGDVYLAYQGTRGAIAAECVADIDRAWNGRPSFAITVARNVLDHLNISSANVKAWKWARDNQGYAGTFAAWLDLSPADRAAYEDGAAGLPTA